MEPQGRHGHIPVLADEVLDWLRVQPGGTYIDGTAGAGGHSSLIAARLQGGRLLSLDRDPAAVARARERLREFPAAAVVHANYGDLRNILDTEGIDGVDGVLIDAGVSSMQIDEAERGFSFQQDAPLDMRMDTTQAETAAEWLRRVEAPVLARVLKTYGDVGPAGRIAQAIVRRREAGKLETTGDLVEAVQTALPFLQGVPDEVRTVFQAVRMAVNEELRWLEQGLRVAAQCLRPGGRLVVLTFHSGEDRVAKDTLRALGREQRELRPDGRVLARTAPLLKVLTPKPIQPTSQEMARNSRSKSAKLRAAERITQGEAL